MPKKLFLYFLSCFILAAQSQLSSVLVADGFKKPLLVTSHPEDADLLFVMEQTGTIKLIRKNVVLKKPFMDIKDRVHTPITPGDERGLLGFAFHPNYGQNGRFFINYINKKGNTVVSEFRVSRNPHRVDPNSERILFTLQQPFSNHNGGHMAFSPRDGYLYIAVGDGGKAADPYNVGQSLETLFGKILRIDVDSGKPYGIPKDNPFVGTPQARGEIWVWGLRNPWRFSFDRETGDLYTGDVGQDKWEEINFQPAASGGGDNYGWRIMEGNHCYNPPEDCDRTGLTLPVLEYPNDANYMRTLTGLSQPDVDGCSVTGGYVYRGKAIPGLQGTYFFGDYCSGNIWSFRMVNGKAVDFQNRTEEINLGGGEYTNYISSFGEDTAGEIYIVDYNGEIYKLIAVE